MSVITEFEFWQWMGQKRKKKYSVLSVFNTNLVSNMVINKQKGCNWEETTLKKNPESSVFIHRQLRSRHQNCCPISSLATWLTQLTCRNRQQSAQINKHFLSYDPKGAKSAAGAGIKSNPPRLWSNAGCLWSCVWITALQKRLSPCCSLTVSIATHQSAALILNISIISSMRRLTFLVPSR